MKATSNVHAIDSGGGAGADAHDPDLVVRINERFRLDSEIARGGMGVVYDAYDEAKGHRVALKRLHPESAAKPSLVSLFEAEFRTLVRLEHPRVVKAFEYGYAAEAQGGVPYYTMELLDGQDLQHVAPLPYDVACRYLRDVASALALLHAQRLIHRDLAPRNVRLKRDGHAKLIDFGALGRFGIAEQVIGTPPMVAPETLHGQPLDQRTDLYALGGLAYWLLTGSHAYPARRLEDLAAAWATPLQPPSRHAADIPAELDQLVVGLLSPDPKARPASCAEVIEHLTNVARLPSDPELGSARSYLASAVLVGREQALAKLGRRSRKLLQGKGSVLLLRGAEGMGRSRLLSELSLEGQLRGASVLHLQPATLERPYALLEAVLRAGLQTHRDGFEAALERELPWLGHILPSLAASVGGISSLAELPDDPGARRMALQASARRVLEAASQQMPLMVLVDDLHLADEPSVAVLASWARTVPLRAMLVMAIGDPSEARARSLLETMLDDHAALHLRGLRSQETHELVTQLFGDAPHAGRLARRVHEASGGNPAICMELIEHMVEEGVIHHQQGDWVLPREVRTQDLPSGRHTRALDRIDRSGACARALAEALSVLQRPASDALCAALLQEHPAESVREALEALARAEILSPSSAGHAFVQPQLTAQVRQRLDASEREAWHLRIARVLEAENGAEPDVYALHDLGWHLLQGGRASIGADTLARAGRTLVREGLDLGLAADALEAALEVYDRLERSPYAKVQILIDLVPAGIYADRRIVERHGDRAIEILLELSGLQTAQRLRRWLKPKLALVAGIGHAEIRRRRMARRGIETIRPRDLIAQVITAAPPWVGVATICVDGPLARRNVELLEPLTLFGPDHVGHVIYDFCRALAARVLGREAESAAVCKQVARKLDDPDALPQLSAQRRDTVRAGLLYALGTTAAYENNTRAKEIAEQIRGYDAPLANLWADQLSMVYHALRGERGLAHDFRERVERHAIEGGTTWQAEVHLPAILLVAARISSDIVLLKRCTRELDHLKRELPGLSLYAETGHAILAVLRGDAERAVAIYERSVKKHAPREAAGWASVYSGYAMALNAAGHYRRAKELCEWLNRIREPDERHIALYYTWQDLELALAEAGLGHHERAVAVWEAVEEEQRGGTNPAFMGTVYGYGARIALMMEDAEAFHARLERARAFFVATENPSVIRHCEMLEQMAVRQGLIAHPSSHGAGDAYRDSEAAVREALTECRTPRTRSRALLGLAIKATGAEEGWLWLKQDGELEQMAGQGAAPRPLVDELLDVVAREDSVDESAADVTQTETEGEGTTEKASGARNAASLDAGKATSNVTSESERALVRGIPLLREGRMLWVGGLILRGTGRLQYPRAELLKAMGVALAEDVASAKTEA